MKILTVVGARPQFVKAGPFSRAVRVRHTEVLVHTGQHYDAGMSEVFFAELGLRRPDHHLGVGSGPHGWQTARMLERLEDVMRREAPDAVVIYGDTNSTLAGALASAKLAVPVAHVEAGLRSGVREMPEEVNRIVADRVSTLLFAPTENAVANLAREGLAVDGDDGGWKMEDGGTQSIVHRPSSTFAMKRKHGSDQDDSRRTLPEQRVILTGDIMYDALLEHVEIAREKSRVLEELRLEPGSYALATVHRAANTDDPARLADIFEALALLHERVIVPLHPRTRAALLGTDIEVEAPVLLVEPVGYLDMLELERNARVVLTDSGGVQKEAYLLGVPCVTLREETEWVETLAGGWNVLAGSDTERIIEGARRARPAGEPPAAFGDGHAAGRMVAGLEEMFG